MVNHFQNSYDIILKNWYNLRQNLEDKDLLVKCIEVDKWWQQAPLVSRYLDTDDVSNWPNPWELINENHYCRVARGLGMFYTLYLLGIKDIELVEAIDYNNEVVTLVIVNKDIIINHWPNTVIDNKLSDFITTKVINMHSNIEKLR